MAGSDIAAAIMGALDGGLRGYGQVQQRRRQQVDDEEERRRRGVDEQLRLRDLALREAAAGRAADRELRTDYEQVVGKMPAGTAFQPNTVTDLRALGMGEMIDEAGTQVNTPDVLGQQDLGLPAPIAPMTGAPSRRETATEQAARMTAQGERQQAGAQDMAARGAINKAPVHLRDWMSTNYAATRKLPATQPEDYTSPQDKAAQTFDAWKRQQDYSHGQNVAEINLREGLVRSRPDTGGGAAGGGGRPITSGDANTMADLGTALTDLDALEAALTETAAATGTSAYLGSQVPNVVTELTGIGGAAKSRQAVIDRVKQVIGKALEGGVLRKEDEIKYTKILPTIGDSPQVASAKLNGLRQAIERRRGQQVESLSDAGYDVSGFVRRQGGAAPAAQAPGASSRAPAGPRKRIKGGGVAELRNGTWVRVE
jgi:hypothetical protein